MSEAPKEEIKNCEICGFHEGHYVCSQAPVISELSKVKGELESQKHCYNLFNEHHEEVLKEKDSLLSKQEEEIKELVELLQKIASWGLNHAPLSSMNIWIKEVLSKHQPSTPSPEKEK